MPTYGLALLQALKDYDRRSRIDRSQKAHEYAEGLLQKALSSGSHDEVDTTEGQQAVRAHQGASTHQQDLPAEEEEDQAEHQQQSPGALPEQQEPPKEKEDKAEHQQQSPGAPPEQQEPPEPGEAVGVVERNSTVTSPKVWIGRCLKVDGDEIVITPFKEVGRNLYIFHVGGGKKRIPLKYTVNPIDFTHRPSDNTYELRTTKTEIHLCLSPSL